MSLTKGNLLKYPIFTNAAMGVGTITSLVTNVQYVDRVGIQLNFTGTPTGTFQIQVSADYAQDINGNVTNTGTWNSIVLSSTPVASGTSGSVYVDIIATSAPWIRTQYVGTSGSGTLNGFITTKTV